MANPLVTVTNDTAEQCQAAKREKGLNFAVRAILQYLHMGGKGAVCALQLELSRSNSVFLSRRHLREKKITKYKRNIINHDPDYF
jgi:hypothetical protein